MKKQTPLAKLKKECVKLATAKYLEMHPFCEVCEELAITAHHFVEQARSNFLRCKKNNLVAVCRNCHFKIHNNTTSGLIIGYIVRKRGKKWFDKIQIESTIKIKDTISYWKKVKEKLLKLLST